MLITVTCIEELFARGALQVFKNAKNIMLMTIMGTLHVLINYATVLDLFGLITGSCKKKATSGIVSLCLGGV